MGNKVLLVFALIALILGGCAQKENYSGTSTTTQEIVTSSGQHEIRTYEVKVGSAPGNFTLTIKNVDTGETQTIIQSRDYNSETGELRDIQDITTSSGQHEIRTYEVKVGSAPGNITLTVNNVNTGEAQTIIQEVITDNENQTVRIRHTTLDGKEIEYPTFDMPTAENPGIERER